MTFWKNKNVLITGGAGFIGSALAKDLVNEGANIIIADNFERGKLDFIEEICDSIVFHRLLYQPALRSDQGDVTD